MKPDFDTDAIEKRAWDLLKRYDASQLPIDVYQIAETLGIAIQFEELDDDVSGLLLIENDQATMAINETQHPNRQRFTIAHEIGHFMLHRQSENSLFVDKKYEVYRRDEKSSDGDDRQEREANRFAAALLMPKEILKKEIKRQQLDLIDDTDAYVLAKRFGVSTQALGFRLARLEFDVGRDF